jgi:xanthine/uracil permease
MKKQKKRMNMWEKFVSSFESTGGALIYLLVLLVILFVFQKFGVNVESQIPVVIGAAIGILHNKYTSKKEMDEGKENNE